MTFWDKLLSCFEPRERKIRRMLLDIGLQFLREERERREAAK